MFTGLIEDVGTITEVRRGRGVVLAVRVGSGGHASVSAFASANDIPALQVGDSVAVSGPCLTVERLEGDRFFASILPETVEATTIGSWQVGRRVNLERALRVGDRLGGHLVTGHVDGVAEVTGVTDRGETRLVELLAPVGLERYLVDRGSVALDGVSLTVRAPQGRRFAVALVRATLGATTLGEWRVGDRVNMEADLLAKHIERLMGGQGEGEGKLVEWLEEG